MVSIQFLWDLPLAALGLSYYFYVLIQRTLNWILGIYATLLNPALINLQEVEGPHY
jgi:hypothetical protein